MKNSEALSFDWLYNPNLLNPSSVHNCTSDNQHQLKSDKSVHLGTLSGEFYIEIVLYRINIVIELNSRAVTFWSSPKNELT